MKITSGPVYPLVVWLPIVIDTFFLINGVGRMA
jgi:hypothetical protein